MGKNKIKAAPIPAPKTEGTVESPHVFPKGSWVLEAVVEFLEENPEGVYTTWVSYSSIDNGKSWIWMGSHTSKEAAAREIDKWDKDERRRSVQRQERNWMRDNKVGQTRQIVQFTLNKKTSKKKIAEYAAQMQDGVEKLRGKTPVKMPKFEPRLDELSMWKIEKVVVTFRKELVNE